MAAQKELLALKLAETLEKLEEEREAVLDAITETGEARTEKELQIETAINAKRKNINDAFRSEEQLLEEEVALRRIAAFDNLANQSLSLATKTFDIINNLDQKELSADKKKNDIKAAGYKKLLDRKLLSQHQYDNLIEKQDKEHAKKKHDLDVKAFKQQQLLAITAALINGALAVTSTLSARPGLADIFTLGVARAIQVGLVVAATALQIGAIASQKPPEAGQGALLSDGPYHKDKERGLHVVNPRTGRTELLLEKDEMVIKGDATRDKKTYTVTGTPAQIGSKINSMHGGVSWATGAVIKCQNFGLKSQLR